MYGKMDSGGVVHGLVEWVSSFDKSVFEDGEVELVDCVCVKSHCSEWVVSAVVGKVSSEITSTLETVVVVDNPSSLEVCDVVEVLNVGNKGSKYKSVVNRLGQFNESV